MHMQWTKSILIINIIIIIIIISSSSSITIEREFTGFHLDVTLLGESRGFNVFSRQQII